MLVTITIIIMAGISAGFWCIESAPFFKAVVNLPTPKKSVLPWVLVGEGIIYIYRILLAILQLWRVSLDILATWFLTTILGANAGGTMGAMIGITMSNMISVYLLYGIKNYKNTQID